MAYFPENLTATGDIVRDDDGYWITEVNSDLGSLEDDERITCRIVATWGACAGIDTDKLWPGAMGEMVASVQNYLWALDALRSPATDPAYSTKDVPEMRKQRDAAEEKLRAILAKLGNGGE